MAVDKMVEHDSKDAIFRVINIGAVDLDSVTVCRPVLGDVEGRIVHAVAPVGGDYGNEAELGPIPATEYARFVLSLGLREELPEFRVRVVCRVDEETWPLAFLLDNPREAKPVLPVSLEGFNQATERSIMDMDV